MRYNKKYYYLVYKDISGYIEEPETERKADYIIVCDRPIDDIDCKYIISYYYNNQSKAYESWSYKWQSDSLYWLKYPNDIKKDYYFEEISEEEIKLIIL